MAKYGSFKYGRQKYGAGDYAEAKVTHHVVMDGQGLMLAGVLTKSDVTSSIPRVSVGTDQKKHTDFSERDTWGQSSYHHGQGALRVQDPYTFLESSNVVTWLPNQVTLMPLSYDAVLTSGGGTDVGGRVVASAVYAGNLFFLVYGDTAAENVLYLYNNTTSSLDVVSSGIDTTAGAPSDLTVFDGSLYVCQGESYNVRRFDGASWTNMGYPATKMAGFDDSMWRADNVNELWYTGSPELDGAATWIGPVEVGDSSFPIRSMVSGFGGALWVGKDDGLYSVRKTSEVNYAASKIVDLSVLGAVNCETMVIFGGNLYMSVGTGIMRYDGSSVQFMGPDRGANETERFYEANTQFGQPIIPQSQNTMPPTFQTGVTGRITMLTHDSNFLYAAVDNEGNSTSAVMLWTGTGWHTVVRSSGTSRIRSVFLTKRYTTTNNLSYPVLWWTDSTSSKLSYMKWSRYSYNPLDQSDLAYAASGYIITPWFDAGLADVDKTFFDFVINAKSLTAAGNSITIEYQVDDYAVWYTLGTAYHTPESVLFFPDDDQLDPSLFARKIRYRITLTRTVGTTTTTPIVYSWGHRFITRPTTRYGWNMIVKVYDNMYDLQRKDMSDRSTAIRQFIYGLRDKRTPIQFFDGTSIPTLTNQVTNPSFEIDTNGDGAADGVTAVGSVTLSMTAQFKTHGVLSQKVAMSSGSGTKGIKIGGNYSATAGQVMHASVDVFIESGNDVDLQILNAGGDVVAATTMRIPYITSENVTRFSRGFIFYDVPTTGNYTIRVVRAADSGALATTFYVDAAEVIVDEADTLEGYEEVDIHYIDGDQLRCRWNGTPHASTSTRQAGYFVYITALTESIRYVEDRVQSSLLNSEITLSLREMQ